MSAFEIESTKCDGLKVLIRKSIGDSRGSLTRVFCSSELRSAGWTKNIAQINHTITRDKGTVRGLHFQNPPHSEMKLVTCLQGEIWDVAVDLRKNSPTFRQWHAERLSPKNHRSLLIPEGFAHGFQCLTDNCELLYLHSHFYMAESEGGINPNDHILGIKWPLKIANLSERDRSHQMLSNQFQGISL